MSNVIKFPKEPVRKILPDGRVLIDSDYAIQKISAARRQGKLAAGTPSARVMDTLARCAELNWLAIGDTVYDLAPRDNRPYREACEIMALQHHPVSRAPYFMVRPLKSSMMYKRWPSELARAY